MTRRPLILLLAVLYGCGSSAVSNDTLVNSPSVDTSVPAGPDTAADRSTTSVGTLADALIPVTPTVATGGAVSGIIGPDAPLTLDALAADGTTFHVEFDQGASVVPVTVTMAPLNSLDGLTGFAAGVDFQPAGLVLVAPAVLTIEGPAVAATSRGFRYEEAADGEKAAPAMVVPVDGPLQLVVGHFSGYGAVNESQTQWNIGNITAAEAREIIALEDFVIANTLQLLKSHDLSEADANNTIAAAMDAINDAAKRLGDTVLKRAETGSVDAESQMEISDAIAVILQAERAAQLSGNETNGDAVQRGAEILHTYLVGVTKHCSDAHDLTVLTLLMSLARQVALIGGGDDPAQDESFRKCMSADVHFTSTITLSLCCGTDNTIATGSLVVEGTAAVDLFDQLPSAEIPLHSTSDLTVHFYECDALIFLTGGSFSVKKASLLTTPTPRAATSSKGAYIPPLQISDASVQLLLGQPLVQGSGCPDPDEAGDFIELFDNLHPQETKGGGRYLFEKGYEIPGPGSAVLARQTFDRTYVADSLGTTTYLSTTVIEIIHTP